MKYSSNRGYRDGFGSFEGVIKTKGELYDFLRKKDATTFIHHDNPYLMNISQGLNLMGFTVFTGFPFESKIRRIAGNPAVDIEIIFCSIRNQVRTQLIGEYNFPNALAAITIGRFFGVEAKKIDKQNVNNKLKTFPNVPFFLLATWEFKVIHQKKKSNTATRMRYFNGIIPKRFSTIIKAILAIV